LLFSLQQHKGDFHPDAADRLHGRRLLHPILDAHASHYRLDEQTGRYEALTPTGRFHVELLRLNRPQLVERRQALRLFALLEESCRLLQSENDLLQHRIVLLETYLRELAARGEPAADSNEEGAAPS
jgi:hypothetical protein